MNDLERLEKIVKLSQEIANSKGKETFLYYLRLFRTEGFNKEKFELLLLKYNIMKKEYIEITDLLNKREILDLLITSILHPS
jgi:hypothetical protein